MMSALHIAICDEKGEVFCNFGEMYGVNIVKGKVTKTVNASSVVATNPIKAGKYAGIIDRIREKEPELPESVKNAMLLEMQSN